MEPDVQYFRSTRVRETDDPGEVSYTCVEGNGSTWTKGSGSEARFVFKRSVDDAADACATFAVAFAIAMRRRNR